MYKSKKQDPLVVFFFHCNDNNRGMENGILNFISKRNKFKTTVTYHFIYHGIYGSTKLFTQVRQGK